MKISGPGDFRRLPGFSFGHLKPGCFIPKGLLPVPGSEPFQVRGSGTGFTYHAKYCIIMLMKEISNEIILRCKKSDPEAYRLVIRHYQGFVFSVIYRFLGGKYAGEIADFSGEIFIRLYEFIKKYDPDKGEKLSTCVATIVRNYCFNELRIKRLELEPAEENAAFSPEDLENETLSGELKQKVEKCVETLPDDQRMILILREYEAFSYEEIAELMNVPAGNVKSKLIRAKIKLKDLLWPYLKEDHGKTV